MTIGNRLFGPLDHHREKGLVFIRAAIGFHLIYGTVDNVTSWARMVEFAEFLSGNGVPWPVAGAVLSAWAQFLCGILFVAGAFTRWAALVMIFNFIAALLIAHRVGGYPPAALAILMLAGSATFLVHGAGRWSVDSWLTRRGTRLPL